MISIEHLILLLVIVLFFRARDLPSITHGFKKGVRNFRDGLAGVKDAEFRHLDDPEDDSANSKPHRTKDS